MTGTFINIVTILLGGSIGLFFGARLPARVKETVTAGLGLFTTGLGIQMFLKTSNPLLVLGSLLIGALLGEWWKIEENLEALGDFLKSKFDQKGEKTFVQGFLAASLLFCIGPISILGAIQDGLQGDYQLLVVKSIMDGFASLAFASTLGIGVLFSSLAVFVYQGSISLAAAQLNQVIKAAMMQEMTAAGGILLVGLAFSSLMNIKKIRVGSFLPALAVAPIMVKILEEIPTILAYFQHIALKIFP